MWSGRHLKGWGRSMDWVEICGRVEGFGRSGGLWKDGGLWRGWRVREDLEVSGRGGGARKVLLLN